MNAPRSLLKFIDRDRSANLNDGIEYYAAGLIVENHMEDGTTPLGNGKDYAVEHIDPFGNYRFEWRAQEDIEVSEISEGDYDNLKACYDRLQTARKRA
jgi:hypothetical protein